MDASRRNLIMGAAAVVASPLVKYIPEVQAAPMAEVQELHLVGGRWLTRDELNRQLWQLMRRIEYEMIRDRGVDTWGRKWTLEEWHEANGPDVPVRVGA